MSNKFIDLFAGIGGFHLAAKKNGLEFVFGSEIDIEAKTIYEKNHKVKLSGDITKIDEKDIPYADWIFGGFPCQSFSRSGKKLGFEDTRGTLFFDVARIAKKIKPKFLLLENVKGLVTHDSGLTYKTIIQTLNDIGYIVPEEPIIISPSDFGHPQRRMRVFIPAVRKDLTKDKFVKIEIRKKSPESFFKKINRNINDDSYVYVSEYHKKVIELWNDFRKMTKDIKYSFSIWVEYFKYKGDYSEFPSWKADIIKKNVDFYKNNKDIIEKWKEKNGNLKDFYPTHLKFEWSCGYEDGIEFDNKLLQFRPSGLRVIRSSSFPTLTTITNQNPIIYPEMRRISVNEFKMLQGFPKSFVCDEYNNAAKQFGNAVNVDVVSYVIKQIKEKYNN